MSENEIIQFYKEIVPLLKSKGFPLTKFFSNNETLKTLIPAEDLAPIKTFNFETESVYQNILGMVWNALSDCFQFVCSFSKEPIQILTRRIILSMYSRIFDPVGFLSPFILGPKLLIQELSRIKVDWDNPVPESVDTTWHKWFANIGKVSDLKFDRCIIPREGYDSLEFHTFVDASIEAYAVVCFCRII